MYILYILYLYRYTCRSRAGAIPEAVEAWSKYHVAPPMSGASDVESEFDVVSLQLEGASELGLRFLLAPADIESELVVSSDVLSATLEG